MKTHKKLNIVILSFLCSSCLVLPKIETTSVRNCDFVRGVLECGEEVEECVAMAAMVSGGWTVIAGSVVVVGNTIHWLEKQGSCDESIVKRSINKLYSSTVELGGLVVKSSSDLILYLSQTHQK